MAMTESSALARVLNVSRSLYSAISKGGISESPAILDSLSAALSHCCHDKKPLAKCMGTLKRELRRESKEFYRIAKAEFSPLKPPLHYDFQKAVRHIPALIYGNDSLCRQLVCGSADKARTMADALKSYPGFLFGEFDSLSDEQFYELVFGFYPKLYDEPFMEEMRPLFEERENP